ncbi:MAG TPA: S16 family serine protease, partial [Actinomycetota bacterium]|nr:S16 family serine protease [Actinomycetota bacterium]
VWRWVVVTGAIVVLAIGAVLVPLPFFFAYLPGPVRSVEGLVRIDNAPTYSSEGRLLLTTVSVDTEVTLLEVIASQFDADKEVVPREAVTGGGSLEDLQRQQRQEMADSKLQAEIVALRALGLGGPSGDGARVTATVPGSSAAKLLEPGDVIVAIAGRAVNTTCDVSSLLDGYAVGDEVELTVVRGGVERDLDIRLAQDPRAAPGSPAIGVYIRTLNETYESDIRVEIDTGRIAGPSAGLMISLALYDRLTPDDLTHGRTIAGTGEIECDGEVVPIGGVEQKVAGAERAGAEIFFAPIANVEAARRAADEIVVVSIGSFEDALTYLEQLD